VRNHKTALFEMHTERNAGMGHPRETSTQRLKAVISMCYLKRITSKKEEKGGGRFKRRCCLTTVSITVGNRIPPFPGCGARNKKFLLLIIDGWEQRETKQLRRMKRKKKHKQKTIIKLEGPGKGDQAEFRTAQSR